MVAGGWYPGVMGGGDPCVGPWRGTTWYGSGRVLILGSTAEWVRNGPYSGNHCRIGGQDLLIVGTTAELVARTSL